MCNKKSIDIDIKAKNGSSVSVDVKAAANHFIVVVAYKNKFIDPTVLPGFYIIPSEKVAGLSENNGGPSRL